MRVLLVEDDAATAQSTELLLKSEGMNVYTTDLGEEAIDLGKLYDYDIILLDLHLPDMSGYEVLRTLRTSKVKTPVLIVSGLKAIQDKVRGLGFGADDYLTKPFHKDELFARIQAVVRRSNGHVDSVIKIGNMALNLDAKTCTVGKTIVPLTGKEYSMVELLSMRKGTTITKEMFLDHLYGGMDEPDLKIIDIFMCKIRKKLKAAHENQGYSGDNVIETVWGRGYMLQEPERNMGVTHKFNGSGADSTEPGLSDIQTKTVDLTLADVQANIGLPANATIKETVEKLRALKKADEAQPKDVGATKQDPATDAGAVASFNKKAAKHTYTRGMRDPVGAVFRIGSLIEVDTIEKHMVNIESGEAISLASGLCTLVEIMSHYPGRSLDKGELTDYVFENKGPHKDRNLDMYMSRMESELTRLIGKDTASTIVQVLSRGAYGDEAQAETMLTSDTHRKAGYPLMPAAR